MRWSGSRKEVGDYLVSVTCTVRGSATFLYRKRYMVKDISPTGFGIVDGLHRNISCQWHKLKMLPARRSSVNETHFDSDLKRVASGWRKLLLFLPVHLS